MEIKIIVINLLKITIIYLLQPITLFYKNVIAYKQK